jgi:hypothetical protein
MLACGKRATSVRSMSLTVTGAFSCWFKAPTSFTFTSVSYTLASTTKAPKPTTTKA